jgi:hypothetical protein
MRNQAEALRDFIRRRCPPFLRTCGRLALRRSERAKLLRELKIRKAQNTLIGAQYDSRQTSLIVYIVDGADWVTGRERISGGLLSIASLFEETKKLQELHGVRVIMVTLDSSPLILRHTQFDNDITVFRLSQVFSHFDGVGRLLIHVPELLIPEFLREVRTYIRPRARAVPNIHINILNQNILLMPPPSVASQLRGIASTVTMTTAHKRYCTEELAGRYGVSVHNFSAWVDPHQYKRVPYAEKSDLLIVSPDPHPMKAAILDRIQHDLPELRLRVIQGLTYTDYKKTLERAKWAVTFGEGLDGYFVETSFSGGIAFAVFNDFFFPKEFAELPTVFSSYEEMHSKIVSLIKELDNAINFDVCHKAEFTLFSKYYRWEKYLDNIKRFYEGDYDIKYNGGDQSLPSYLPRR